MAKHVIQAGECVASVAFEYGFFPDTVWDHPANAELRQLRQSGFVLSPGDVLEIPDKRERTVKVATGRKHAFRRKGVPERVNLVLRDGEGKPRPGVKFSVEIDGTEPQTGKTDGSGKIEAWIPPAATQGVLRIDGAEIALQLGHLEPVDSDTGVRARLKNLGFLDDADAQGQEFLLGLVRFQQSVGLPASETVDERCREKLREAYGC